jgi:hypothetical protein
MTSKIKFQCPAVALHWLGLCAAIAIFATTSLVATAQAPSSFPGTVTAISGTTLTVKTDAGDLRQVDVPAEAMLKRIAPGQKDLSTAADITFADLATGDRVLVKLDPSASGPNGVALRVIAIKQADVAAKQAKEREDWARRSIGGLVKSVDPASGVILVTSGSGTNAKTITVNTTKSTILKRYAPASVSYDSAAAAPIDSIHAGDQLRARGAKSADGTQIAAEEVVSGTFRNISGAISTIDPASGTFQLKDLATKKVVTIHVSKDAQMRRIPDMMARMLAARLNGGAASGAGARGSYAGAGAPSATGSAASPTPGSAAGTPRAGGGQWTGQGGGQPSGQSASQWAGQGGGGGDPNQMLTRLPPIQITDLKKGDAVMLVATDGTTDFTAITLLAGVDALLEAPAASQTLLNNWSMGSGSPDAGMAQ